MAVASSSARRKAEMNRGIRIGIRARPRWMMLPVVMPNHTDPSKALIEQCIAEAPILEYDSPANRARLTRVFEMAEEKGITVPQLSLAWLLHQDLEIFPLIAPSARHIAENLAALDVGLTQQEADWLLNG